MTQAMQFKWTYVGPCYLSDDEKIKQRHDIKSGEFKERLYSKDDLKESLKKAGMLNHHGTRQQLQEQCE